MTLVSTVAPLAGYAIVFQTIVYLLLPARRRTLWAPVLTGIAGAVVTLGAGWIFGFETIGLGAPDMAVVFAWALATVVVMSAVGFSMLRNPTLRSQLADPRLAALTRSQMLTQVFVRIPVMTALIEEAFFRGVLHAALIALYPPSVALVGGAVLFGLWHVGPGFDQAQASGRGWRGKRPSCWGHRPGNESGRCCSCLASHGDGFHLGARGCPRRSEHEHGGVRSVGVESPAGGGDLANCRLFRGSLLQPTVPDLERHEPYHHR